MKILSPESQPSNPAPLEYFTGSAHVTPLVQGEEPSCLTCASVAFAPGARSAWHRHRKGQLLLVTAGAGLIQEWGKPVQRIRQGDVIWTPAGIKHWHGAAPETSMTHTAVRAPKRIGVDEAEGVDGPRSEGRAGRRPRVLEENRVARTAIVPVADEGIEVAVTVEVGERRARILPDVGQGERVRGVGREDRADRGPRVPKEVRIAGVVADERVEIAVTVDVDQHRRRRRPQVRESERVRELRCEG